MKASSEQLHVLNLTKSGRDCTMVPLVNGKGSQSRTVGRGATISTCVRNGWLQWNPAGGGWRGQGQYELTESGEAVLMERARLDALKQAAKKRQAIRYHTHWEKGYRAHGLWLNEPLIADYASQPARRLGVVTLGPPGLWDGKTYMWEVDSLTGDQPLHKGEAPSLKAAKHAVEALASDVLAAWWRGQR
ncbi:hypothetical protein GURKE_01520 [Brevundimonas phage vB_BpoS-Gurke]|uniref:Uncharacterized protein n=1 Tax=Brevundimonas phage vB_BpoS-Gurke TaxID=2948599 RepID=A0A9E7N3I8_9CAUD|nr:hypothetical protein GURKE_01520 [Brevundimonas phage vB_BpoS-Gurke]